MAKKKAADQPEKNPAEEAHYDEAVETLKGQFQGIKITVGKAPQTRQWASDVALKALKAVGAEQDSARISSR